MCMFCEMNNLESLLENCGAIWDLSKGSVNSLRQSGIIFIGISHLTRLLQEHLL